MAFVNLGQILYPVGSIYQSFVDNSPATLFGGTWAKITDRFLLPTTTSAGATGGVASNTLTINQMPKHDHKSPLAYFIIQSNNSNMRTVNKGYDNVGDTGSTAWGNRLGEDKYQNPLPTTSTGGGGPYQQYAPSYSLLCLAKNCIEFLGGNI